MVMRAWVIPDGNGGSAARRINVRAAASSAAEPEEAATDASVTRPERSTVKRSVTRPSSPRRRASSG